MSDEPSREAHYRAIELHNDKLRTKNERLLRVKETASIFASQGHRQWCNNHDDPSALVVECNCGLRELRDALMVAYDRPQSEALEEKP